MWRQLLLDLSATFSNSTVVLFAGLQISTSSPTFCSYHRSYVEVMIFLGHITIWKEDHCGARLSGPKKVSTSSFPVTQLAPLMTILSQTQASPSLFHCHGLLAHWTFLQIIRHPTDSNKNNNNVKVFFFFFFLSKNVHINVNQMMKKKIKEQQKIKQNSKFK